MSRREGFRWAGTMALRAPAMSCVPRLDNACTNEPQTIHSEVRQYRTYGRPTISYIRTSDNGPTLGQRSPMPHASCANRAVAQCRTAGGRWDTFRFVSPCDTLVGLPWAHPCAMSRHHDTPRHALHTPNCSATYRACSLLCRPTPTVMSPCLHQRPPIGRLCFYMWSLLSCTISGPAQTPNVRRICSTKAYSRSLAERGAGFLLEAVTCLRQPKLGTGEDQQPVSALRVGGMYC